MNHIFVDFENVPTVDLGLIGDKVAKVTLLIGQKQRRLELSLVQQIREHAAKVELIEVGASGRNALDLVLAWHLGKTAERRPKDPFFVISKDKDFDPLIAHLRVQGLNIARLETFSLLPFLTGGTTAKKPPRRLAPLTATPTVRKSERPVPALPPVPEAAPEDRLAKLIYRLQHKTNARPVRRKTLLSYVDGFYGKQLSAAELEAVISTLEERGIIDLDPHDRVLYPVLAAVG